MLNLREILYSIDTTGKDVRLSYTLDILKQLLGESLIISTEELQHLPERLKSHLEIKLGDNCARKASNGKYRLSQLLRLAIEQGILSEGDLIFQTDFPIFQKPKRNKPNQRRYHAYLAFEKWCAQNSIKFEEVCKETFRAYRKPLRGNQEMSSGVRQESKYSDLRRFWLEKVGEGLLPEIELPRWKDESKDFYGLARRLWPVGCREDFGKFERGARNDALEGEKRWRGPLRNVSISDMEKELCQYLGYLKNIRKSLPNDTTLFKILGNRDNMIGFIEWHIKGRCNGQERKYHQNTLKQIATLYEWLGGHSDTVEGYHKMANCISPKRVKDPFPSRPIEYDEFIQAAKKALLDKKILFENTKKENIQAKISAACGYRDALIFSLLICRPLRSRNLREMELGHSLYKQNDTWKIRFMRHEAKARSYACDFPEVLVPWLEYYINQVRHTLLQDHKSNILILTKSGRSISPQDLWRRLRKIGDSYLGIETNPHLFRYLVPSAYLSKHPGAINQMQALLGHGTVNTTLRSYVHTYSQIASLKVATAIREHCPNFTYLASLYPE